MLQKIVEGLFGSKKEKDLKDLSPIIQNINAEESWAITLKDDEFKSETAKFKKALAEGTDINDLVPKSFALVREAARRKLGERAFDTQMMGALVLHQGRIMEMKTGEGKTLSSVPAAYLNALTGNGVHVVTVNDYLAERDALWMKPVYDLLGITVGYIIGGQDPDARAEAYKQDITYGTNNEFGFDYLRDNMKRGDRPKDQNGHAYCIIDEIDSILIDEARTPLIISGAAQDDTKKYRDVNRIVSYLKECEKDPETEEYPEEPVGDYTLDEKSKRVSFTDQGLQTVERLLQQYKIISGSLFDGENFGLIHTATQAVRAHRLYHLDTQYVVKEGLVQIVDEFTGRILHGRRYGEGLHQAIEAKEGIKIANRNQTIATITLQNYFRLYNKISGMTGTAETEAKEFAKIYGLDVVVVPTNRPVARMDQDDYIFVDEDAKFFAIIDEIRRVQKKGQPVLVGTVSIEKSERLSKQLQKNGISHEVLNAKNHAREASIIAEAGAKGSVTIATNMAGRGTDIKLGGNPEFRARKKIATDSSEEEILAAIEREKELWKEDYNEVRNLGGLYIVGTERHESRRIDNQLRGRSGRQGDPGESRFFLSMDDDLMRLFGGGAQNMKSMMMRTGMADGEALNHPLLNRAIERAQNKVEERNFEIRKHTLEFDDVLNEQRKFIYNQRDKIREDKNIIERVFTTIEDVVDDVFSDYKADRPISEDDFNQIKQNLIPRLYLPADQEFRFDATANASELAQSIFGELKQSIVDKLSGFDTDLINGRLKQQYLQEIDLRWLQHLEQLEALREAVYLRQYAQKNPLLEYKLEGFKIFDELILQIRLGVARMVIRAKIQSINQGPTQAARQYQTRHQEMNLFSGGSASQGRQAAQARQRQMQSQGPNHGQRANVTVQRTVPKVGRNDPCPCGSGKKYKHCHGA